MLTIKSNFNTFKERFGQTYTVEDLQKLSKNVITADIINLRGNMSYGYTDAIAKEVIKKLTVNKSDLILVINDLSLEMYNALTNAGYTNIIIAYGKWTKAAMPEDEDIVYNIMANYIKANFNEQIKIIKLKEIFNMKYKVNAIIANPPYGAIGANITKTIIDNIDFDEYVNLLPANDYKRNKDKDLFNYQSDMVNVNDGFADAAVTTHLARIHKTKVNELTAAEFDKGQYIDKQLDKYFTENIIRKHQAIDSMPGCGLTLAKAGIWPVQKTFIIGYRDMNHKHLPYSKNCTTYKWNIEESIDMQYLIDNCNTRDNRFMISQCIFGSESEKTNFVNFVYSANGFRFISKLFTAVNCDGTIKQHVFPKVDWTRQWTVEEILADYGYTEDEIKEVRDDLKNFKGMED